jgi:ABC-type sugar transport system permease subunit
MEVGEKKEKEMLSSKKQEKLLTAGKFWRLLGNWFGFLPLSVALVLLTAVYTALLHNLSLVGRVLFPSVLSLAVH